MTTRTADYLDLSFDKAGIRNSQKRLKGLIAEVAVEPLHEFTDDLQGDFNLVEEIIQKRIAHVIMYWAENKHDPVKPNIDNMMSDITNSSKSDISLRDFYTDQVEDALHTLAPTFGFDVPEPYQSDTDELEFALLELEEHFEHTGGVPTVPTREQASSYDPVDYQSYEDFTDYEEDEAFDDDVDEDEQDILDLDKLGNDDSLNVLAQLVNGNAASQQSQQAATVSSQPEKDIVVTPQKQVTEVIQEEQINISTLNMTSEEAWQMIYNLMGYQSEYIQEKMLPRWQQNPDMFEKDRRFLYGVFIQAIRNAAGVQYMAGNFTFADQRMTVDQLWNYYFQDLSQNVGPQLSVAKLEAAVNDPWHKKAWQWFIREMRNLSLIWLMALAIALVFDGLTTYVSLDQTPMDGFMVWVFTLLITALFQIADMLVINYRKREFESDALIAKYQAKVEQLDRTLEGLSATSASYVQLSMERSQANADWMAARDNRKLARRGRYWSARIADINILVTAYGFAFMFLNAAEPMYALYEQINFIFVQQAWERVNLWVFIMVGLAVTVSFVINTAQRTEILGWSMRRLKTEA